MDAVWVIVELDESIIRDVYAYKTEYLAKIKYCELAADNMDVDRLPDHPSNQEMDAMIEKWRRFEANTGTDRIVEMFERNIRF